MQSHRRRLTSNEATVIPLRASLVWRPRQRRSSRALAWSAGLLWLLFFALSGTLEAQSARQVSADIDPQIGEGANEILVAVRDSLDGWGVVARFENQRGFELVDGVLGGVRGLVPRAWPSA